ncbi:MAG: hypothetical protein HY858_07820 [Candidatus Solibacter usitatus]|nr:hypothetical protein [Candidatus Solibacter usitatus]
MQDEHKELAEIMRFQQSLLRLVTRGAAEQAKSTAPASEQTKQLEVWVRKVHPKAN